MKAITLNEYLNAQNPWSKRLLGSDDFQKVRDIKQVENEYNLDKYAKLLSLDLKTIEEYKAKEFEQAGFHPVHGELPVSFGDELFSASIPDARAIYYGMIKSALSRYASKHVCELGCGYGYNLSLFGNDAYGGEYSRNAVQLGKRLGMDVSEFNYYDSSDYDFIKPDSTILTVHSIEQIPDATVIIDNLERQKAKIRQIIHFEPTVIPERSTLLGLLRNKYLELNDYNRNLLTILKSRNNIEILELKTDLIGLVPLNSANLIIWKFKN